MVNSIAQAPHLTRLPALGGYFYEKAALGAVAAAALLGHAPRLLPAGFAPRYDYTVSVRAQEKRVTRHAVQAPHRPRLRALWAALLRDWAALGAGAAAAPPGYAPCLLPAPAGPLLPAVLPYLARAAPATLLALGALCAEDARGSPGPLGSETLSLNDKTLAGNLRSGTDREALESGGGSRGAGGAALSETLALLLDVCLTVVRDAAAALAADGTLVPAASAPALSARTFFTDLGAMPSTEGPVPDQASGGHPAPYPNPSPPLARPLSAGGRRRSSSGGGAVAAAAGDEGLGSGTRMGLARGPPDGAPPLPALAAAVGALRLAVGAAVERGTQGENKEGCREAGSAGERGGLLDTAACLDLATQLQALLLQARHATTAPGRHVKGFTGCSVAICRDSGVGPFERVSNKLLHTSTCRPSAQLNQD